MKTLLSLLLVPLLLVSFTQVFGQQVTTGTTPHEIIKVVIDESGTAHVTHKVKGATTGFTPIQVDLLSANVGNLTVTDANGTTVEYGKMMTTVPSVLLTTQKNITLIQYDLVNVVTNNNGVWTWNYFEPQDTDFTAFYFPKGVDMVWANDRPVYLGGHGLGQHGNGFKLEYTINEPIHMETILGQDKNFDVVVRSVAQPTDYSFDKSARTYSFNVTKANVPIVIMMPQDLLAGPYAVTVDGKPTLHQTFHNNDTYAWIGIKPTTSGIVLITGAIAGQGQTTIGENTGTATIVQPSTDTTIPIIIGIAIAIAAGIVGVIVIKKKSSKK